MLLLTGVAVWDFCCVWLAIWRLIGLFPHTPFQRFALPTGWNFHRLPVESRRFLRWITRRLIAAHH
jgi:hypothetical protein